MSENPVFIDKNELDKLADESGLAIVFVDASKDQVASSNDNSICRNLNPDGRLVGQCSHFCGTALEEATEVGSAVTFTCHAGLECRAATIGTRQKPLVAIVGRTFVKAEKYRRATERAISGDWTKYPPSEFFENVLISDSSALLEKTLDRVMALRKERAPAKPTGTNPRPEALPRPEVKRETAADRAPRPVSKVDGRPEVKHQPATDQAAKPASNSGPRPAKAPDERTTNIVDRFNRELGVDPSARKPRVEKAPEIRSAPVERPPEKAAIPEIEPRPVPKPKTELVIEPIVDTDFEAPPEATRKERRTAEARAWRSFFGSLLRSNYAAASASILDFLASQYGFKTLVWLDRKDDRFDNTATFGGMKNRKVRLGIAPNDNRLIEASQKEMPLELGERAKGEEQSSRTMSMFPIGVGDEISAAIAILDPIADDLVKKQIARICHSIAPQLEILRLRSEVERGDTLATAVRSFSESLKRVDADDLWLNLTQNAAEMLRAERASLLIYDEKAEVLEIKAMVGLRRPAVKGEDVGGRVAKIVFAKREPVVISDIAKTGLPPAPDQHRYKTPSFLSCPIVIGDRSIGVMNFADRASGLAFDKSSLEMFQAIAPQLAVAIDRASLKEKAGEFEQLSVTDALTGLLNRRYIEERLMEEIKRSNRHGYPMSFMMLDVDDFKSYNDRFGHPAGDEALKIVGHVVRETLRGADVAARFGGEEFAILLPQTTIEEAMTIAQRIRYNIEHTRFSHRRVTVSIGVASCSAELCVSADLISAADKALYEAKHQGRNKVLAFEEMPRASSDRSGTK